MPSTFVIGMEEHEGIWHFMPLSVHTNTLDVPERDLARGWEASAWLEEPPFNKIITGSLSLLISCHLFSCTGTWDDTPLDAVFGLFACWLTSLVPGRLYCHLLTLHFQRQRKGGGNQMRNTIIKTPGQHLLQTSIPVWNFSVSDLSVMVHKGHSGKHFLLLSLPSLPSLLLTSKCSSLTSFGYFHLFGDNLPWAVLFLLMVCVVKKLFLLAGSLSLYLLCKSDKWHRDVME